MAIEILELAMRGQPAAEPCGEGNGDSDSELAAAHASVNGPMVHGGQGFGTASGEFLNGPPRRNHTPCTMSCGPAEESGREDMYMPTMPTMPTDAHWKSVRERIRFLTGGGGVRMARGGRGFAPLLGF